MKVFTSLENYNVENTFLSIGTFDGLHLGHQKLIGRLIELAKSKNANTTILTFWPHPKIVLAKETTDLKLLNTIDERISLIEKLGIDNLIVFPFTKEFSLMSSDEFIEKILIEKINIKALIIGYDHNFGNKKKYSKETIYEKALKYGFYLEKISALTKAQINISSTKIREALNNGDIELAKKFLSYNYFFSGRVAHGKKIGRNIGFPTANIKVEDKYKLIPGKGVYAVNISFDKKTFLGMMNIGTRPTLESSAKKISLEVNIFDFNEDIYNKKVKITMLKKIRDEKKFAKLDELKLQLSKDKQTVLQSFKR